MFWTHVTQANCQVAQGQPCWSGQGTAVLYCRPGRSHKALHETCFTACRSLQATLLSSIEQDMNELGNLTKQAAVSESSCRQDTATQAVVCQFAYSVVLQLRMAWRPACVWLQKGLPDELQGATDLSLQSLRKLHTDLFASSQ